jgi:LmbE family N-acetylglucosaminyl deacetylase
MFRMMCVTAHPDDEAGNFGGVLSLYHSRGVETLVVCLTPGQAASHRGGIKNDQELAEARKQEFAKSCEILGVSRHVVLGHPDGQLYRQELNRLVYQLTSWVRKFRPHVMLTFGPDGGVTGHPDHGMAGVFASLAFHWSGHSNRYADQLTDGVSAARPQKLYYCTAEFELPDRQPIVLPPSTAIIDIGEHLETKIKAFKAHQTQSPLWPLFEDHARKHGPREMFHLAAWVKNRPVNMETDLFDGVEEE